MPKLKDLTGQKFGRLTVIERAENAKDGRAHWRCHCDCGNEVTVSSYHLTSGHTQSCGCLFLEGNNTHHKMAYTPVYSIWQNMLQRCNNPNRAGYKNYGGRGISVFPEWQENFQAFYNYVSKLEHFGEEGYTIDRIDNNANYEPDNLRWADRKTQNRNRRNTILVEYDGKAIPLTEAVESSGIDYATLSSRLRNGDTDKRLFRPVIRS